MLEGAWTSDETAKLAVSETFYAAIRRHALDAPDQPAIRFLDQTWSYDTLRRDVNAAAAGLAAIGVDRGSRLALMLPNVPQFVIGYLAAIKLGAIVVPINPLSVPREIAACLADSGAERLIVLDLFLEKIRQVARDRRLQAIVVTGALDCLTLPRRLLARLRHKAPPRVAKLGPPYIQGWKALIELARGEVPEASCGMDEPVLLGYTGGMNGRLKAAALSHRNLTTNAAQVMSLVPDLRFGEERVLAALPFCHGFGLTACLNAPLMARSLTVLLPRFDAAKAMSEIEKQQITLLLGVPAMFGAFCDCPKARPAQLRSVRNFFSGGAPLTSQIQTRFEDLAGKPLANCYGLTEAAPAVTGMPPSFAARKPGSVGRALRGTRVAVLYSRTLAILPAGQIGELAVKGPQVMTGYWQAESETSSVIKDGWLLTGDLAWMDPDGFVYLVGHSKRIISVGGFKVYPQEVESVLRAHPLIHAAVVTGVADGYRGELVKAVVTPTNGHELTRQQITAYCRSELSRFKVPKLIEIRTQGKAEHAGSKFPEA